MAKTLQFDNNSALYDATEVASLKLPNSVGSNISLTVDDSSDISDNDYLMIGKLGQAKTEIVQVNATVSSATSIQVDTLAFVHQAGTPITKLNYNQVEISRATTSSGSKTTLTTVDLDVDNIYTSYRDTVYSSGYVFFRLKNEETSVFSGYSAAYSYDTADSDTIEKIKELIKRFYEKKIDDTLLDMLIDSQAQEIYSMRHWKFREATASFESVSGTANYTLTTAGITDLSSIVYITYDNDPVWPTDMKKYQAQNWNVSASGQPSTFLLWDDYIKFTPIPSSADTINVWYYKNHTAFTSNTSTTGMELPSAIAYGVLRDLWGPKSKTKFQFFSVRYNEKLAALKKNDEKELGIFQELTRTMNDVVVNDQVRFPNTITPAV